MDALLLINLFSRTTEREIKSQYLLSELNQTDLTC